MCDGLDGVGFFLALNHSVISKFMISRTRFHYTSKLPPINAHIVNVAEWFKAYVLLSDGEIMEGNGF